VLIEASELATSQSRGRGDRKAREAGCIVLQLIDILGRVELLDLVESLLMGSLDTG